MHVNPQIIASPSWSTASHGDTTDTSPLDLSSLARHLDLCRHSRDHLFVLRSAAQSMSGFVAGRFVTTVAVLALLIGIVSLVV